MSCIDLCYRNTRWTSFHLPPILQHIGLSLVAFQLYNYAEQPQLPHFPVWSWCTTDQCHTSPLHPHYTNLWSICNIVDFPGLQQLFQRLWLSADKNQHNVQSVYVGSHSLITHIS